jgi:hypothetical protein
LLELIHSFFTILRLIGVFLFRLFWSVLGCVGVVCCDDLVSIVCGWDAALGCCILHALFHTYHFFSITLLHDPFLPQSLLFSLHPLLSLTSPPLLSSDSNDSRAIHHRSAAQSQEQQVPHTTLHCTCTDDTPTSITHNTEHSRHLSTHTSMLFSSL